MKPKLLLTALASATVLLGGCAVYPEYDPYYDPPVVRVAPPPPQYEYVGAPPVVGHVWIGGYWNWIGARYVWVPGRWEAPRHGYYWAPHRWERDGDHWRMQGGRWERGENRPHVVAPPPPVRMERHEMPHGAPAPQVPRFEQRPIPQVAPPPPQIERREIPQAMPVQPAPRIEPESRRPPAFDPRQSTERRSEPPRIERDNRDARPHDDRRNDRRKDRDRDGDGRPDAR